MRRATHDGRVEQPDPPPLDQLLPPHARPVDLLALGHQDRRTPAPRGPARRGNRLRPRVSDDPERIGPVVLERLDHGPPAGVGLDGLEDPFREQRHPFEGLVATIPRPGIGPFGPRDLIGDQPVAARRQAVRQGPETGEVVGAEVGETDRDRRHRDGPPSLCRPCPSSGTRPSRSQRTGHRAHAATGVSASDAADRSNLFAHQVITAMGKTLNPQV